MSAQKGKATLDFCFDEDKQIEFQCMIANSRVGFGHAAKAGDVQGMTYYGASMAAYLDVLKLASPHDPAVNESDKP